MKLLVIIGVLVAATSAIRVPSTWTTSNRYNQQQLRPQLTSENVYQQRPHGVQTQKHSARKHHANSNLKTPPPKYFFKPSATINDWTPIFPAYMTKRPASYAQNKLVQPTQYATYTPVERKQVQPTWYSVYTGHSRKEQSKPYKNPKQVKPVQYITHNSAPTHRQVKHYRYPLYKNYRDDRTHEPSNDYSYRDDRTHEPGHDTETVHEVHIDKEKQSDHELALDVPTRPIYPGEGQWSKKGIKHKPYISNHKFTELEDEEEKPDGHEVFEENRQLFENERQKFRSNIDNFPQDHKLGHYVQTKQEPETEDDDEAQEEDDDSEDEPQEFVPVRLYTQVRRSETEEHLPRLVEDPRLREVIKDSKIQTVYTEEGYEDIAYDHAGHEKTAEQDEGFSEFDREIEKEKQRRDKLKVKHPHKTETEEDGEEVRSDTASAGTHHKTVKKPVQVKKDKLLKTKETKTMSLKDQDDGAEMEVLSEIKVLATPQNGTKKHRYLKIAPKKYKYEHATTTAPGTSTSTQPPQVQLVASASAKRFRVKRFTNDFHKVTVDTDFIDQINHNIPQPVQIREKPKYPYYNIKDINPYSPLRYAEDLDNIPKKTEDPYAFYNQADLKMDCADVQSDVDPVPQRVKEADADPENMEDTTDVQELVKTPRLKNLGDKIDCFKLKYFGEDPLDSPFFKEKEIGPVIPLIDVFRKRVVKQTKIDVKPNEIEDNSRIATREEEKREENNLPASDQSQANLGLNILTDVVGQFGQSELPQAPTTAQTVINFEIAKPKIVPTDNVANHTEPAVISIITTPKYTINLKPKHIYHQIELLQYLPHYNSSNQVKSVLNDAANATEAPPPVPPPTTPPASERRSRIIEEGEEEATTVSAVVQEVQPPDSQALRQRRRRIRPPKLNYQIFDVNKYLPQNSYTLLNQILRSSTVRPTIDAAQSEVHYKHEINPSEQMAVFADVLNNIKNASKDPHQIAASSSRVAVQANNLDRYIKNPRIEALDNIEHRNTFYLTTTTTTPAPRGNVRYITKKIQKVVDESLANKDRDRFENLELLKVRKVTTSLETKVSVAEDSEEESGEESEEPVATTDVLGLMPPGPAHYKTIVSTKRSKPSVDEVKLNRFYVVGMKPPAMKQKVILYSDYKVPPGKYKAGYLSRGRRSAQRPAYSAVVRNRNKPIDVEDDAEVVVQEDDDYVPHRPRNYHYDEKTGRIVYANPPKATDAPEEEYIEVTDAPLPAPTRRNAAPSPKFKNFTGPSFVDFVSKLKSDPNYQTITDPPTTEKSDEVPTTTSTTPKPVSTTPPEFLNILAKVRTDSSYKEIKDKTTTKATTTTTVEPAETAEESQVENVQNSPGGQVKIPSFQIFDINDYLPKIKSYTPRTSIDYSKYKTIERANPPMRHNLSSRYNSENEELEKVNTSKMPILMEDRTVATAPSEVNQMTSESKHEDVHPSSTSVATEEPTIVSTTSSRRIRTRARTRATRRPTQRVTTAATSPSPSSAPAIETPEIEHDKPRRNYLRRRPSRIKINKPTNEAEEISASTKVVRRRHQRDETIVDEVTEEETTTTITTLAPTDDSTTTEETVTETTMKSEDVQVFKPYDKTKKHGGNYRREHEESESKKIQDVKRPTLAPTEDPTTATEETATAGKKSEDVQVFKPYDKTKKHGGNYRREHEQSESKKIQDVKRPTLAPTDDPTTTEETATAGKKSEDMQVFKPYDKTKKHGGNYRREHEESESKKVHDVKRLTDIVPKPDAFYTDPKLPKKVNQLMEVHVSEEDIEDGGENEETTTGDYEYEVSEEKTPTTKKPVFVKDPNKRLYYYAPL